MVLIIDQVFNTNTFQVKLNFNGEEIFTDFNIKIKYLNQQIIILLKNV